MLCSRVWGLGFCWGKCGFRLEGWLSSRVSHLEGALGLGPEGNSECTMSEGLGPHSSRAKF